jgi:hypothetical protein
VKVFTASLIEPANAFVSSLPKQVKFLNLPVLSKQNAEPTNFDFFVIELNAPTPIINSSSSSLSKRHGHAA